LLQQYFGPEGSVALSNRPDATDAGMAHYHDGSPTGAAHGLQWTVVDDRPADELATLAWFDQNDRSEYLAHAILDGKLSDTTEEERDLAVSWVAYLEDLVPDRPRYGIREDPLRAEQRAFMFELQADLRAVGGEPRDWGRLGDRLELADGTVLVVENVSSDGGIYPGWYCVSRYRGNPNLPEDTLVERTVLG
jgi:hypothetical protein